MFLLLKLAGASVVVTLVLYNLRRGRKRPGSVASLQSKESNGNARRSRFRGTARCHCFCATSVSEYNIAAAALIRPDDVVLEIGCQFSSTTCVLSDCAAKVIGIDIASKTSSTAVLPAAGRKNVCLSIVDIWDLQALQQACSGTRVALIAITPSIVLGHDLLYEVLALLRVVERLFDPRVLLVKSKAMVSLQQSLSPSPGRPQCAVSAAARGSDKVQLVAANGVNDYRDAALGLLERFGSLEAARVLEIGSFEGASIAAFAAKGATACLGVDVSAAIIQRGKKRYPGLRLDVADAWDGVSLSEAIERSSGWGSAGPELICVDVGGLSGASGALDALALLKQLCTLFPSSLRAIVIKSSCLRALAHSLRSAKELGAASQLPGAFPAAQGLQED